MDWREVTIYTTTEGIGPVEAVLEDNGIKELPAGVEGLHFHVLCESRPEHLRLALDAVEKRFGRFLDRIKWLNMGGGHLMTHKDYDCDELIRICRSSRRNIRTCA